MLWLWSKYSEFRFFEDTVFAKAYFFMEKLRSDGLIFKMFYGPSDVWLVIVVR